MKRDVRLRVRTVLPERLLREAARRGILLTEAALSEDGDLSVVSGPRAARRFMKLCDEYRLPVRVERVEGAGALLRFMRRRATLPLGALLFVVLTLLAAGRIWRVDVQFTGASADTGDRDAVYAILNDLGVRPGASNKLDTARLSGELTARLTGCSYVDAKLQGVRLLIEAAVEAAKPEVYELDVPRDLCARRDGVVVSVNVRAGQACVSPGDAVRRGQTLIRGEELARGGGTRAIAALGEVAVRCWAEGAAALPVTRKTVRPTGRASTESRLAIFDQSITLARGDSYERQRVKVQTLPIGGLFLPVEILRETRTEVAEQAEPIDADALRARLSALALADARARFSRENPGDCAILREWLEYEPTGGGRMTARAVLEYTTDAAVPREAL